MGLLLTHVLKYHRELAELVVGGGEQTGQECGVRTHRSVVCAHAGVQCVQKQECGVCTRRSVVCAHSGVLCVQKQAYVSKHRWTVVASSVCLPCALCPGEQGEGTRGDVFFCF